MHPAYFCRVFLCINVPIPTQVRDESWLVHKWRYSSKINACKDLASCLFSQNKSVEGLQALFRSFQFDEPRAEICCDIGYYFLDRQEYNKAIFWYELALTRHLDSTSSAFQFVDCYNYIPYIQLCICYDKIGNKQKSYEYNELAGSIKPYDESYLYNKNYFENYFNNNQ